MIWAAVQMCSSFRKEENYAKVAKWVAKACEKGARAVVLPEHWHWLGAVGAKPAIAENVNGPSIRFVRDLARKYGCLIVAGSIAEKRGRGEPPYNTAVTVYPDGTVGSPYRKIHLFDAKAGRSHRESETTSAGSRIVIENLPKGKLGLAICYDLRFPELFQVMAKRGVEIFALPANFTAVTGPPHWEVLVRSRAIENQCYVVAADQTGITGAGWEAHGHSMIVDPWGAVLARAGRREGVITAELDFHKLQDIRKRMPVQAHRKLR